MVLMVFSQQILNMFFGNVGKPIKRRNIKEKWGNSPTVISRL